MVSLEKVTDQLFRCKVIQTSTQRQWNMTFVYGFNKLQERKPLWPYIGHIVGTIPGSRTVIRDFNAILHPSERSRENKALNSEIEDFHGCRTQYGLSELRIFAITFSWTNKRILSKIGQW